MRRIFSHSTRARGHQDGFTLIEVLVAVSILAVITLLAWTSIANMFVTRDIVSQSAERYQIVRLSMNRMATEISGAYIAGPEHGGEELPGEEGARRLDPDGPDGEPETAARTNRDPVQFGMIGRQDRLDFTSFAHVRTIENERAGFHTNIGYFVRRETNEEGRFVKKLMRRHTTTIDDNLTRGGVVYTMVPEIEDIKFEYWDTGEVKLGTAKEIAQGRWVTEWDTTRRQFAGRLPSRVRITLTLPPRGPRGAPEAFTTQTHLSITEVLEF